MMFLTGCSQKSEIITIDDAQYVKSGNNYVKVGDKYTFNPGEHYVYYSECVDHSLTHSNFEKYRTDKPGWGNITFDKPETPEGYRFLYSLPLDTSDHGLLNNIVYVFVNDVSVEAQSVYNEENDVIGYFEPGVPVVTLGLEQ